MVLLCATILRSRTKFHIINGGFRGVMSIPYLHNEDGNAKSNNIRSNK